MKVLLSTSPMVGPSPFYVGEKRPPLGLLSLAAVLRSTGHEVDFVDPYVDGWHCPALDGYDAVGVHANTICFRGTLRLLEEIRGQREQAWQGLVMVGGPHASVCPETIPDWVDYVVQGEGEEAILQIVDGRGSERVLRADRIHDLDRLPRPAWDLAGKYAYNLSFPMGSHRGRVFTMNTSRGCPRRCTFCSVSSIWGTRYTCLSAARVVADIEALMVDYGATGIYFREDEFTLNLARVRHICELLLAKGVRLEWMCEARADSLLDRELLRLMQQAGCTGVYVGVESGSDRMLEFFGKGITAAQIREAFFNCRRLGLLTAASIVVGTGYETAADYQRTADLLHEIRPTVVWQNQFTGIPYSPLYHRLREEGRYQEIDDIGLLYPKR